MLALIVDVLLTIIRRSIKKKKKKKRRKRKKKKKRRKKRQNCGRLEIGVIHIYFYGKVKYLLLIILPIIILI